MGISGHILGDRKLRALNREFPGYNFDRAFRYHGPTTARALVDGKCVHYTCNHVLGTVTVNEDASCWSSCKERM